MSQQIITGGNGTTGQTGEAVKDMINENFTEVYTGLADHLADAAAAHAASAISFTPTGTISATTVQAAIAEVAAEAGGGGGGGTWGSISGTLADQTDLDTALDTLATNTGIVATDLSSHLADATAAHAASAISFAPTGTVAASTVQDAIAEVATDAIGVQDLYIPVAAMLARTSNGCAPHAQFEIATSLVNILAMAFDQTNQEYAQFSMELPRKWNNGTVTAIPYWTAQSGSGTVRWTVRGGAYSNDDPLSTAMGTAQNSDDTLLTTNDMHVGPETAAITIAGTPASQDFLVFEISRDTSNDTLSADALLLGVVIRITTTAAKDA